MPNKNRPSPPRLFVNPTSQPQPQSPGLFSSSTISSTIQSPLSSITTPRTSTIATTPRQQQQQQPPPQLPIQQLPPQQPTLETILTHLRTPLHPLVSSITGLQHPSFPRTLLSYNLLTSHELDALARHYHQVWPPVPGTFGYPISIPAWGGMDCGQGQGHGLGYGYGYGEVAAEVDLTTKRRRFGRFIGLRGCESPVLQGYDHEGQGGGEGEEEAKEQEEMLTMMEREWRLALERAASEDQGAAMRSKWW